MLKNLINKIFNGGRTIIIDGEEYEEIDLPKIHNKGVDCLHRGKYKKAIKQFKKETELADEDFMGHWLLGITYKRIGGIAVGIPVGVNNWRHSYSSK